MRTSRLVLFIVGLLAGSIASVIASPSAGALDCVEIHNVPPGNVITVCPPI